MSASNRNQIIPSLITEKLEAFERLEPEFDACFRFKQEVHGQKRFAEFPVAYSVRYLHSLWICECKDRLLSIYKNIKRYEGGLCLALLKNWQEGDTASVVDFFQRKLDMPPLGDITRQLQMYREHPEAQDDGLPRRLMHGRLNMLNRAMNVFHALDTIFALPDEQLMEQVRAACVAYGHTPTQIEQQQAEMETPLFSYVPHQILAQRNMVVMNKMGVDVMDKPTDQPGQRSWRVLEPAESLEPMTPFADHLIQGYVELTTPVHNNPKQDDFTDQPEHTVDGREV